MSAAEDAALRSEEKRDRIDDESERVDVVVVDERDELIDVAVLVIVEDEREVDSELRLDVVEDRRVGLSEKSSCCENVGLARGE